jgi:hypothetical protein
MAVLNFVFGGIGVLATLAALAGTAAVGAAGGNVSVIYLSLLVALGGNALEIIAGVGYLGQKKMGRSMGNSYAMLAILATILSLVLVHTGFGFLTVLGLVYPVVTLALINTTFKDNLVD